MRSLTLLAKRREFSDSPKLSSSGDIFTNIKLYRGKEISHMFLKTIKELYSAKP